MKNIPKYTMTLALASVLLAVGSFNPVQAQYDELILDAEPFAYWRLNDDDPDFGPIDDGLGDGIEGTYENVELQVDGLVPGEDDKAIRFNGASSIIRIPDDAQTNSGGPYVEKTIEFWFSADDAQTESPQVIFEQGGTTRGITFYVHEGEFIMGAWNRNNDDAGVSSPWMNPEPEGGPDDQSIFFKRAVESNTAYHAAMVFAGDDAGFSGTVTGYLDGFAFGQGTGAGQLFNHGDDLGIGAMDTNTFLIDGTNPGGDGLYFSGVIDEVALYNEALDEETILAHALIEPRVPAGDFNSDGVMDVADYEILRDHFGGTFGREDSIDMGDFNRDRTVDLKDFALFREAYRAAAGGQAAAVPEPSSLALIALSLLGCLTIRSRRS